MRRLLLVTISTMSAPAYAFTVNSFVDAPDLVPGNGACAANVGLATPRCTLRAAITEARWTAASGNTVITLQAGTYAIGLPGAGENMNTSGDFDIGCTDNYTLSIVGAGTNVTFIDGDDIDRVFHVLPCPDGISVEFSQLTIKDGTVAGSGGGILMGTGGPGAASTLNLTDVVVTEHDAAGDGGGVYVPFLADDPLSTVVSLTRATVGPSNHADGDGGGLWTDTAEIHTADSIFVLNDADGSGGGLYILDSTLYTESEGSGTVTQIQENTAATGGGLSALTSEVAAQGTKFHQNIAIDRGGGAFADGSALTLTSTEFLDNVSSTDNGGGLAVEDDALAPLGFTDVLGGEATANFMYNSALHGAGVWTSGSPLTMVDVILAENVATGLGGGLGADDALIDIADAWFKDNEATGGGGAFIDSCDAVITDSTFENNDASGQGGGLAATGNTGWLTIEGCTAVGNSAALGGGFAIGSTSGELINSTVSGNSATSHGGGIYFLHDTDVLTNWVSESVTVALNTSTNRCGGVHADGGDGRFWDSIIGDNTATNGGHDCGLAINLWNSLLSNGDSCAYTDPTSTSLIGTTLVPIATGLDPLAYEPGSSTLTHALQVSSPAINLGGTVGETYDQTGYDRQRAVNGADAGAYEYR